MSTSAVRTRTSQLTWASSHSRRDAVIVDLTPGCSTPVLAAYKAPTSADITTGIQEAIAATLTKTGVDKARIQAVAIGTTSFINSLIERDASKLSKVAVIRLCGPFSRLCPPFASFPYELRAVLEGPIFYANGGVQVDGSVIAEVSDDGYVCYPQLTHMPRSIHCRSEGSAPNSGAWVSVPLPFQDATRPLTASTDRKSSSETLCAMRSQTRASR